MNRANFKWKVVRFTVFGMSLLFIGAGLVRREHLDVLQKAVRICLECVGIG